MSTIQKAKCNGCGKEANSCELEIKLYFGRGSIIWFKKHKGTGEDMNEESLDFCDVNCLQKYNLGIKP